MAARGSPAPDHSGAPTGAVGVERVRRPPGSRARHGSWTWPSTTTAAAWWTRRPARTVRPRRGRPARRRRPATGPGSGSDATAKRFVEEVGQPSASPVTCWPVAQARWARTPRPAAGAGTRCWDARRRGGRCRRSRQWPAEGQLVLPRPQELLGPVAGGQERALRRGPGHRW